jgi:hypothetical protein
VCFIFNIVNMKNSLWPEDGQVRSKHVVIV